MQYLFALLVLTCISFAVHKKLKLVPTTAFLFTMFSGVCITFIGGVLNLLFLSTFVFYALGILSFCVVLFVDKKELSKAYFKTYFTLPSVLSISAILVFWVIYFIQKPLFSYWDEYSFWGSAAKIATQSDMFPMIYEYIYIWNEAITAGSTALVYVMHFFGNTFNDYGHYFAYTVMMIASFGALTEYLQSKFTAKFLTPIIFVFSILLPFLQNNHSIDADYYSISFAYGTSMPDFLLVTYMIAAVVMYLSSPKIPYFFVAIFVLSTTKDVGVIFAALSLCIIICFMFFIKQKDKTSMFKKITLVILAAIISAVPFLFWHFHVITTYNPVYFLEYTTPDFTVPSDLQTDETLYTIPTENNVIIPPEQTGTLIHQVFFEEYRNSAQNAVYNDMWMQFSNSSTAVQIPDRYLVVLLFATGMICSLIIDKKYRLALILANIGLPTGYFLYCSVLSIFIANFNDGMVEYPRYSLTYYWFWIYFVYAVFVVAMAKYKKHIPIYALTLLIFCVVYARGTDYTVISAPDNHHSIATEYKLELEKYQDVFAQADNIFMVAPRFDDYHYMLGLHNAIPAPVNADIKGTTFNFSKNFSNKEYLTSETLPHYIIATDEEFLQIVFETFDYILILHPQEEFVSSYGEYFDTEPEKFTLYKVNKDATIPFESVTQ